MLCKHCGKNSPVDTLRPKQNGRHFPNNNFKCIFLNEKGRILDTIRQKFVNKGPIDNNTALVHNGLVPNRGQAIIWINDGVSDF